MDLALLYTLNAFAVPLLVIATIYVSVKVLRLLTTRMMPERDHSQPSLTSGHSKTAPQ